MEKKNILIFPCGSEPGLEICRSLKYSKHFEIFGGSSVDNHGKFVYKNYIGNIPFIDEENFIVELKEIIKNYHINAIYPTLDNVVNILAQNEKELNCKIICSPLETTEICLSKLKTYSKFKNLILTPNIYYDISEIECYPVFLKPEIGYGGRGTQKVNNIEELKFYLKNNPSLIILEYLSGKEYTVDCFTNWKGELIFVGPRERCRIRTGTSVNTKTINDENGKFKEIANIINSNLELHGAWFFQLKENDKCDLKLLEIASRIGGSSGIFRSKGINLPLLTLFDAFGFEVNIVQNDFIAEMDRALDCTFNCNITFDTAYIDLDDCLIINKKVNTDLIKLMFQFINEGKKIILLTKHQKDINKTLADYRLLNIFDEIIQITKNENKADFITNKNAILIDDSFIERMNVSETKNIPTFALDALNYLQNNK
jgi:hypothetical protein